MGGVREALHGQIPIRNASGATIKSRRGGAGGRRSTAIRANDHPRLMEEEEEEESTTIPPTHPWLPTRSYLHQRLRFLRYDV